MFREINVVNCCQCNYVFLWMIIEKIIKNKQIYSKMLYKCCDV